MPLGIQQNNNFAQIIVDIWNDKVFYQEQEFPAGFMAASILNISEDDLKELIQAGGAPTFLFPVVIQGSDVEAARVLPVLRERMIYLTKEIWKYPPFCYSNPEKELRRIDILFDDNALSKIRTPNSEFQQEFLIFCAAITRIPMAILHFIAAGRFFELDYLRRLKKRNETYFAMAAHDCFSSKEFWDELRELQSWDRDIEPFSVYWTCSGRSAGATDCDNRRVREDMVYEAFTDMVIKLKANQADLLGTLIRQIEAMQDRTSRNQERIRQIDKEIADLGAKNLVITRLHTSGVLDAADYAKQTSEIGNRITDLRIERRKKLTEDEDDILLDTLKALNGILEEYEPTAEFDNDLFEQIVQDITVNDNTQITFRLLGDIQLTEKINEKGRCKSA